MEVVVGVIFLVEYLLRAVDRARQSALSPSTRFPRLRYALTPIAIIDLLAILPALFAFGGAPSLVLRFFRVLRMLRLAKLGRTSRAWDQIRDALYERRYEFALILGLLAIAMLIAGVAALLGRSRRPARQVRKHPARLVVGDRHADHHRLRRHLSRSPASASSSPAIIAITGVMLVALPTGLFAASFTEGMQRHRDRAPQRLK